MRQLYTQAAFTKSTATMPSPKIIYISAKTEPLAVGADETLYIWFPCEICEIKKPYRCIRSSRDRLGLYAEIQIVTV